MNPSLGRLARIVIPALAIGLILAVLSVYFQRGYVPGDAFTYLSAGERLNAGHPLYALSPGDRPVALKPPYWTVPLLSPPPIAVLFRPFALLSDAGAYLWWALCILAIAITMLALLRRRPVVTGVAMLALTIPIVYEIGVGNLNAIVVALLVGAWYLLARHRPGLAGTLLAFATALKVTPGLLAWWLITQRQWSAFRAFIVAGVAALTLSIAGAGLGAHLDYLSIVRQTATTGTSDLSLAGLARMAGVPATTASTLPLMALIAGVLGMWLLRNRAGAAWAIAIVTMLAASPVVNVNWFTFLLVALAPLAWPVRTDQPQLRYRPGATTIDPSASR